MTFVLPPWSYSFLAKYDQCPRACHEIYVAKSIPYSESEEQRWGNEVHSSFEQRLRNGKPLIKELSAWEPFCAQLQQYKIAVELKLAIGYDGKPAKYFPKEGEPAPFGRGVIDVAVPQAGQQVEAVHLLDWKTGKKREDARELRIQAMLLFAERPYLKRITGQYVWLKSNELGKIHDVSDVVGTWNEIVGQTNTIIQFGQQNHWPARQTPLCNWCPVKKCPFNPHS